MQQHWLVNWRAENFERFRSIGFSPAGFSNRYEAQANKVQIGDKVAFYVPRQGVRAICEVTSGFYYDDTPVWVDASYPYRFDTRVIVQVPEDRPLDLKPLVPKLNFIPSPKKQFWGTALQGKTLQEIPQQDFQLIESEVWKIARMVIPLAKTTPQPQVPPVVKKAPPPLGRVFGPPLNFRELRHEPLNEHGVVYVFGMVARELGFLVEAVASEFPDCSAKRGVPDRPGQYQNVDIEFEFKSSNFRQHGHDPNKCDLIVCWGNDWPDCPIEVIELKNEIKKLSP